MSGNLSGFDATKVERTESTFDLLPAGSYKIAIVDAPLKDTRAGDGKYLSVKMQVIDGKYQNRFLWDNLNTQNPNPQAVKIGEERLAEICEAVQVLSPKDSSELCHKPLVAVVGQKKRKDTGEMQNVIRQYQMVKESQPVDESKAPWDK